MPERVAGAALCIAFALLLHIAGVHAFGAARVGGKVSCANESPDWTRIQQDDRCQKLPTPGALVSNARSGRTLISDISRFLSCSLNAKRIEMTASQVFTARPTGSVKGISLTTATINSLI